MNRRRVDNGDEFYSKEETERRRDAAVIRALNTPPNPHKSLKATTGKRGEQTKAKQ